MTFEAQIAVRGARVRDKEPFAKDVPISAAGVGGGQMAWPPEEMAWGQHLSERALLADGSEAPHKGSSN